MTQSFPRRTLFGGIVALLFGGASTIVLGQSRPERDDDAELAPGPRAGAYRPPPTAGAPAMASSVAYLGVTFYFSEPCLVGHYCYGEPWVLPSSASSAITRITPDGFIQNAPGFENRAVHGVMKNPGNRSFMRDGSAASNALGSAQGYDGYTARGLTYNADFNLDPGLKGAPIPMTQGVYVKAISNLDGPNQLTSRTSYGRGMIYNMIPLTVVPVRPAPGAFRPPLASADKRSLWKESDLDYTKLPNLKRPANAPRSIEDALTPSLMYLGQTQATNNTNVRNISPSITDHTYGRDFARDEGEAMLALCLSGTNAEKRTLALASVQRGLDVYGRCLEGGYWVGISGGNCRMKMPMVLAGILLGDAEIQARCNAAAHNTFCEDLQIEPIDAAAVEQFADFKVTGTGLSIANGGSGYAVNDMLGLAATDGDVRVAPILKVTAVNETGVITGIQIANACGYYRHPSWPVGASGGSGSGARFAYQRPKNNYRTYMIGMPEWSEQQRHPTPGLSARPGTAGWNWNVYYRQITNSPTYNFILLAHLIPGARKVWGRDATFDYFDRAWNLDRDTEKGGTNGISFFCWSMWKTYRGKVYAEPPKVKAAAMQGELLWITCTQMLDSNINPSNGGNAGGAPRPGDFAVTVNGAPRRVDSLYHVIGYACVLKLSSATSHGDVAQLSYTPGGRRLRNLDEVDLPGFSGQAVANLN